MAGPAEASSSAIMVTPAQSDAMSAAEIAVAPFNQETWDRWLARGRASDTASAGRARTIAIAAAALACLAASVWTLT